MAGKEPTIGSRYGLNRDNFILDPVEDYKCFARHDINTQEIAEALDIDVVTGLAPKRLVWGPYGAGKTHTLMRTMEELSALTKIHPIRIECPDLAKKSRFHDLYREGIMRSIGQDFVLELLEGVVHKVGFKKPDLLRAELKEWLNDEEMAKAVERLYDPNFGRLMLWRWLSGVAMGRTDLNSLGQTQDLTETEAARLADILVILGRLLRRLHEKTLVLILDEMERLGSIGAETITTFMSGFTRLVDPNQKSVCILIGASAATLEEMVDLFSGNSPVTSRLGQDAMIHIPALQDPDVDGFVKEVIKYLRESTFNVEAAVKKFAGVKNEKFDEGFFPFTANAVEAIKSRTDSLTPRAINMQMTRALGRAHRKNLDFISTECVG
jgi:Cdc6-like AAA superfamily ATPase